MSLSARFAALLLVWSCTVSGETAEKGSIDTGATTLIPIGEDVYAVSPNFAGAAGALILSDKGNIVVDSHGSPAPISPARAPINFGRSQPTVPDTSRPQLMYWMPQSMRMVVL